ncbi:hypothetical protein ALC62_02764 [Cyphomyrmex costatus]|uniref:Secreted protein n=1 Tax=Cyphomyrmex costatus TaxID=456900 RepID=A0A151IMV8_9HYME|nr:hypothetical protein ALC62_02764 [Cyphomyrmex costatus]
MSRKALAYSLSLLFSKLFMRTLDSQLYDSGKHVFGTTPCLVIRFTIMSHWPPSQVGSVNRKLTKRPSTGSLRFAVFTILCRKLALSLNLMGEDMVSLLQDLS